jgi:hypothetical protein
MTGWRGRAAGWLRGHRKLAVAVAGAVLTIAAAGHGGDPWVQDAVALAAAAGVYAAPNRPR